jgi:hypothetical protein
VKQRALTGAVRPDDAGDLARPDVDMHVAERQQTAEPLAYT